MIFINSYIF